MPTHYILYALPNVLPINFKSVQAALLQSPVYIRWSFTEGYFSGLYTNDIPHEAQGTALVYVYLKDDSITPLNTAAEITTAAREFIANAVNVDISGAATHFGAQVITLNIKNPAVVHSIGKSKP